MTAETAAVATRTAVKDRTAAKGLMWSAAGDTVAELFEPADGGCTEEKRLHVLDSKLKISAACRGGFQPAKDNDIEADNPNGTKAENHNSTKTDNPNDTNALNFHTDSECHRDYFLPIPIPVDSMSS